MVPIILVQGRSGTGYPGAGYELVGVKEEPFRRFPAPFCRAASGVAGDTSRLVSYLFGLEGVKPAVATKTRQVPRDLPVTSRYERNQPHHGYNSGRNVRCFNSFNTTRIYTSQSIFKIFLIFKLYIFNTLGWD